MLDRYPLFQHAYLVEDLDISIRQWNELFGAGPFVVTEHHRTDTFDYRGTTHEADVSYAFGYLGDLMIQFIVQHDDTPSIYRDMYPAGSYGFHHVATLVHDFEAEFARFDVSRIRVRHPAVRQRGRRRVLRHPHRDRRLHRDPR